MPMHIKRRSSGKRGIAAKSGGARTWCLLKCAAPETDCAEVNKHEMSMNLSSRWERRELAPKNV